LATTRVDCGRPVAREQCRQDFVDEVGSGCARARSPRVDEQIAVDGGADPRTSHGMLMPR